MKYLDEFRDENLVRAALDELRRITTGEWTLMEVCGGQTHAIVRFGLDRLLPGGIELVHGPGCPVCVTPLELIDKALIIAARPEVIFCSFGDMLRVPGSHDDLFRVRSRGGDVRVVYSPLDALKLAVENPDRQVVFFAIGFETTAPANAMAVLQAERQDIRNFSLLVAQVRVPPAITAILESPTNRVRAFLAAGHVCTVMGYWEYEPLAARYGVPIIVTGFEPLDIARGVLGAVRQLETGRAEVENAYERAVTRQGNQIAQKIIAQVFEETDRNWRGIGQIPASGWKLRDAYRDFDAELRFEVADVQVQESAVCISGLVLQGVKRPHECPAFGRECTPEHPLGATMVSSEGACAAYYQFGGWRLEVGG
jgi:hydrogenase expression/formation protein HypD